MVSFAPLLGKGEYTVKHILRHFSLYLFGVKGIKRQASAQGTQNQVPSTKEILSAPEGQRARIRRHKDKR